MKLLHAAGGVRTTVMADVMQRAPAFGFGSAREARAFGDWLTANFAAIKTEAEATTRVGHLHDIEQFSASRFLFLRFNFTTGDAAGQNLTGEATQRACAWIRAHYAGIKDFCLEANLATDKKSSHVNILRTRGKRVTAEATIPADLARQVTHTTPWSRTNGSPRMSGLARTGHKRRSPRNKTGSSQSLAALTVTLR
jgi:hydroxymethylglutaryl-CoA reductase (NADPH)